MKKFLDFITANDTSKSTFMGDCNTTKSDIVVFVKHKLNYISNTLDSVKQYIIDCIPASSVFVSVYNTLKDVNFVDTASKDAESCFISTLYYKFKNGLKPKLHFLFFNVLTLFIVLVIYN